MRRRRSLKRQVTKLEQQRGSRGTHSACPWDVPPALTHAIRTLKQENPRAIEALEEAILRHERLGGPPAINDGLYNLTLTDEERAAWERLIELEREEAVHW